MSDIIVSRTFGSWIGQVGWLLWCPVSSWRRIPSFWSKSQSSSSMPSQSWNEITTFNGNTEAFVIVMFLEAKPKKDYEGLTAFPLPQSSLNTLYSTICSPDLCRYLVCMTVIWTLTINTLKYLISLWFYCRHLCTDLTFIFLSSLNFALTLLVSLATVTYIWVTAMQRQTFKHLPGLCSAP